MIHIRQKQKKKKPNNGKEYTPDTDDYLLRTII